MDIFKKKSLCAALAGMGALATAGVTQAVNLNPDGLGQVLIYPYYTVRANTQGNVFNSMLSVVNTTASVKAVKVRFLEGKNSQEVLDFNLFLSAKDVWTAAVVPEGAGAKVITADNSCTLPVIPAGGQAFRNSLYATDGGGAGLDRTTEGYIEIIEMATYADGSDTAAAVTHDSTGVPDCGSLSNGTAAAEAGAVGGGLMGGITLINVDAGSDYTADAVALDNFAVGQLYTNPGSLLPDLTFASPPTSIVISQGGAITSNWAPFTADPVSAVLMHDHVMNEFVLDAGTQSGTDWVVTMPTKRFYVSPGTGTPDFLFQRNFNKTEGACDDVQLDIFDREEQTTSTPVDFSPPDIHGTALCWEANVITFNDSNVLGSMNSKNIATDFEHGWLDLSFFPTNSEEPPVPPIHTLANFDTTVTALTGGSQSGLSATYIGLPVVGFAVQSFTNGAVMVNGTATLSNYGGNFIHKGTRGITVGFIP
jgi:hypothetical protein